ncbi:MULTISPECIES: CDP-glucose 4,6-dehydratase [unclassified Pseudomonas]|uniref:CDP-glucose 4,6-dehydratase n=1 Tax=unclassified Pseudomonas TaxID=196821 RepID=UPI002AC9C6B1|nr:MULTISPECIES: CDP-glucose 4,6-dehydratase [unclassified Pseudomonas]MEB0041405.1 CDP-glucose 4,6-dehydratase [Pseudomonas sp. MH10]MEB0078681.1 CDP-glucose 4,6-dehydratase [Pseudomonas sp. MH10out]MEB0093261.1 CDP-glucose 4,6-dehydratase [Pseudomonas sp. CCI4.2]MEB0103771.1 CDP-glucose 4,6-dehydratase [Pseudomonas sp. CCI3.2]MEB0121180.1 CDP-glucose 4,6-dehydratase [Pseudomonas sp. CCI1.2]
MEAVGLSPEFWRGKRVLLTGHTGFKGSWLALWLKSLGANVTGFALDPSTEPNLYALAQVGVGLNDQRGDLRDLGALLEVMTDVEPEIVLHLAAQPLVREGYRDPLGTYSSNVMGTLNLLEAIRQVGCVRACVLVTTDKVYANKEWLWPYRESEALGGHDPYSSSKACCELLAQSYAASFFAADRYAEHGLALATARAGNVLGGGDFAPERLIPDVLKAWSAGEPVTLRYPQAVRPWQHALEPLAGYLQLAAALYEKGPEFGGPWNFGPSESDMCSVGEVVDQLAQRWPLAPGLRIEPSDLHEAALLRLDSSRAHQLLAWHPRWSLQQGLEQTLDWHLAWKGGADMGEVTLAQLNQYRGLSERGRSYPVLAGVLP